MSDPPRVLCCYAPLHPQTAAALQRHAPQAELIDVSGDITAYWREMAQRWVEPGDLVNIDHDIGIRADVLPQFASCPEPWCLFPYPHAGGLLLDSGLGCARFRAEARKLAPLEDIAAVPGSCALCGGKVPGCWVHVEGQIAQVLHDRGVQAHVHAPAVEHYHYQQERH